tara:strand:+ start:8599 stop:11097 length:2499 start_codon:yes stop_codon:yes gene_type:complete
MAKSKVGSNNITIEFRPKGEKQLIAAIQALSVSTTQLAGSQKQLGTSIGLTESAQKKQIATGTLAMRNQRNMTAATVASSTTFSVLRSRILLATFAVGLYTMTVGRLTKAYAEQESSEARIDAALASTGAVVGRTSEQIQKLTERMQKTGIVGDELNNKMASILLTFTNIRGQAFERTMVAANNMAISISGGIPTFEQLKSSALQLGKALQDPAGQLGALSRSGFTFSGTQKEMIKNLVEQNRLQEAQNIILDAADTQFGELNEEMRKTVEGSMQAMKNAASDLAEAIGELLAPSTIEFTQNMTELFESLAENKAELRAMALTVVDLLAAFVMYKAVMKAVIVLEKRSIVLKSILNPAFAAYALIVAGVSKEIYKYNLSQSKELDLAWEKKKAYSKMKGLLSDTEVGLQSVTSELEKQNKQMKISNELKIANINLENALVLQLTEAEIEKFQQKKRDLMITQELLKLDADKRESSRDEVKAFVDKKIAYENYLIKLREHIDKQKEINDEMEKWEKIDEAIAQANKETDKNIAVQNSLLEDNSEKNQKRIKNLIELEKQMSSLGVELPDFIEMLEDENLTIDDLIEAHYDLENVTSDMIAAFGMAIASGADLAEVYADMKEKLKELKEQESPFEIFEAQAGQALDAYMGFSAAYGDLTEQRMNRELEALKTTREYENATQEQREIMENNIARKFKQERKRAFKMEKAGNIASAAMNTAAGVSRALKDYSYPASHIIGGLVAALGAAQIAAISAQPAPRFGLGGSFITSGPRNILVGEEGAERVTIQPLGAKAKSQSSGGGQNITVNISAPLVDETIVDVIIPKIKEATKLNLA